MLNSIYLKCETGKITGLLGRNGSGKSCLMKIAFGSMRCIHKSIRIDEERLLGDYIHRKLIGYLPQERFIPDSISMRAVLGLFRISEGDVLNAFPEWHPLLNHKLGELSGGHVRLFEAMVILL